jgi:hypothetical protein
MILSLSLQGSIQIYSSQQNCTGRLYCIRLHCGWIITILFAVSSQCSNLPQLSSKEPWWKHIDTSTSIYSIQLRRAPSILHVSIIINFKSPLDYTVDCNFYLWIKRRMHLETLRQTQNRESHSNTELLNKHKDQLCGWYQVHVRFMFYMII